MVGCMVDAVFSILPLLMAKRLAVTARCFRKSTQHTLFHYICLSFQQPIEMWEGVIAMNPVIPMAIRSVQLVAFEEADMTELASFIPKVQQGLSLHTVILSAMDFSLEFICILSPILTPFSAIHINGSTYNDSEIGMLFHLSPRLSELHMGGSQVSSFTGVTLSEDVPMTKCISHDDSSPIHRFSYNAEKGIHFLLEHPGFSSRIQPRMTMLHSLFICTDYQAFDFIQNIVSAARDTLHTIDVILGNCTSFSLITLFPFIHLLYRARTSGTKKPVSIRMSGYCNTWTRPGVLISGSLELHAVVPPVWQCSYANNFVHIYRVDLEESAVVGVGTYSWIWYALSLTGDSACRCIRNGPEEGYRLWCIRDVNRCQVNPDAWEDGFQGCHQLLLQGPSDCFLSECFYLAVLQSCDTFLGLQTR